MKAAVDRIDEGIAILILCDNDKTIILLPSFLLPDVREGDIVDIRVVRDKMGTIDAREKSIKMIENIK
jgi:hypothetical protein